MRALMKYFAEPKVVHPPLGEEIVVYAIGDIHGHSDLLDGVHAAIDRDVLGRTERTIEVYLGDYFDRGPDSKGVVDRLIARGRSREAVFLRGNHEEMFERFLSGRVERNPWRSVGGFETLMSYGIDQHTMLIGTKEELVAATHAAIPEDHRLFLQGLRQSFRCGSYFFVHAGIRPGIPLEAQVPSDAMWIREPFLSDRRDHDAIVVHGHTPQQAPEFLPNRINIDTGAYMTGRLTCLRIDRNGPALLETAPAA